MTLTRSIIAAVLFASGALAHALEIKPYSAQALAKAQKANQPVALHFHADWCPVCRAQSKVLEGMKADKKMNLTVFVVNYDKEKDMRKQYAVRTQSTIISFIGKVEAGRLAGDSTEAKIREILSAAL